MTTKAKVNRSARAKFFRAELALAVAILAMPIAMIPAVARAQSTVRLSHSVPPAAATIPNASAASPSMPMELVVRLALRNTAALDQLKRDQQDPSSPSYHQWLTPQQFNARFGPTQADADAIAQWLRSSGFTVKKIDLAQHSVVADANAAVVSHALDVAIVSNGTTFANTTEPAVPARLAPLIADIQGLNNAFAVKPMLSNHLEFGPPLREGQPDATASPDFKTSLGLGFSASDLRTYYNEAGLISGGITGTKAPDCIALAATSDLHNNSIGAFTSKFGLPATHLTKVFASTGGNPGFNSAELEAALDVEGSHTIAPSTPIRLYIGKGANDLQDAINRAVTDNACGTLSISFGYCINDSTFFTGTFGPIFTQAAVQGQSVFVSSGDQGAAGIVFDPGPPPHCVTGFSPNVNELCANPDVTCVGGTEFNPTYDSKNRDTSTVNDALESAWNEVGVGATGGGESVVFARPSYQSGLGLPGGNRLVPDVSLQAALRMPGFYIVAFYKGALRIVLVGGTSLSSPLWAGYSRIIAGVANKANLGPFNPMLYTLGAMGSSSGLIDVISGDNSFNGVLGFSAGPGYDETTGWGSPDMTETLISFLDGGSVAATPASLSVPKNTVIMDAGDLTITNTSSSTLSVNSVTVASSRSTIFKSVSLSSGGQTVTPKKSKMMVFTFSPPIMIAASGGMAIFKLGATMTGLAQAGTPSSTQTVGAIGVSATKALPVVEGVTFEGLPTSLGTITLTH
jgi:subtilase family serine protease